MEMTMSDFEDDDDRDDSGPESNKPEATYRLTIDGLPHSEIMKAVFERISRDTMAQLTAEHKKQIRAQIEKSVDDAVVKIVDARLEKEVNDIIDNGWQQYDLWGEPTGKRMTLRELITGYIMKEVDQHGRDRSDSYSDSNKRNRIYWFVEKAINGIFDKETSNLVENFRKQVRERFTADMAGKVAESIKSALGLK
jgi:hypothetical protein